MNEVKKLAGYATATGALAVVSLMAIAIVTGLKGAGIFASANCTALPNSASCVFNESADAFVTGLAIFGSFMVVVTLSIVGKVVIGIFKED